MDVSDILITDKHIMDAQQQRIAELEAQLCEAEARAEAAQTCADVYRDKWERADEHREENHRAAQIHEGNWLKTGALLQKAEARAEAAEKARDECERQLQARVSELGEAIHRAEAAEAENKRLRECIEQYANEDNWIGYPDRRLWNDRRAGWTVAQSALQPQQPGAIEGEK